MAKGITRTLQTTEIKVAKFENGELIPLESIIEDKEVSKEEALKIAKRLYKNEEQVIVTDVIVSKPEKRRSNSLHNATNRSFNSGLSKRETSSFISQ